MGPEQGQTFIRYCSGPDCLCTRRMHVDPVGEGIVLCDYCGRCYWLRTLPAEDPARRARMAQDRAGGDAAGDRGPSAAR